MEEQVKNVKRPPQGAFEEHANLLNQMGSKILRGSSLEI
jgi:hypothetical protein